MPVEASETIFSSTTLLWLVVSLIAGTLLFGSINRRRTGLIETLRGYVNRSQEGRKAVRPSDEGSQD